MSAQDLAAAVMGASVPPAGGAQPPAAPAAHGAAPHAAALPAHGAAPPAHGGYGGGYGGYGGAAHSAPGGYGGYGGGGAGYGGAAPGGYAGGSGGGQGGGYGGAPGGLGSRLGAVDFKAVETVGGQWQYYEHKTSATSDDVRKWRAEHSITLMGDVDPEPMMQFLDLVAPEQVHRAFAEQGFTSPTPIQAQSWPILLQSRDMVGVAKTGSGKTLAFIIPAILHINAQPPLRMGDGPIALVLAPTRELAVQIEQETRKVSGRCALQVVCLYGGTPKHPQMRALRAGTHIAVATPGRLIDMLEARATNLLRVTYLVLDEADRMLDMGFEPQVRKICSQIRPDRQTLMFSATWPVEVRRLAESFMRSPVRINVGSQELQANADVKQHISVMEGEGQKLPAIVEILRRAGRVRTIVFCNTKRKCDDVCYDLRRAGFNALAIHGDKDQFSRDRVLARLKHETDAILVATDVAARGLDVKELQVVVNFDFPNNVEDYVHRIGRTGRAGKTGDAYTFIIDESAKTLRDLIVILQRAKQNVPPELETLAMRGGGGGGYGRGRGRGRGRFGGGRPNYGSRDPYGGGAGGGMGYDPMKRDREPYRPDDRLTREGGDRRGPRPEY